MKGTFALQRSSAAPPRFLGVFAFTLLMISREGMETALLMGTLLFQVQAVDVISGAVIGTVCAAFVASLWSRYGHRVNLGLFFQVTAVFLLVFVVQLLIYGFHELTEANIFPYSEPLHWATEPYGPDGRYGRYLTYLLVMLPLGWLVISTLMPRRAVQQESAKVYHSLVFSPLVTGFPPRLRLFAAELRRDLAEARRLAAGELCRESPGLDTGA